MRQDAATYYRELQAIAQQMPLREGIVLLTELVEGEEVLEIVACVQRTPKRPVGRFVTVFARPEHPLALFVDDLQWIDPGTLDMVEHLLTHSDVQHLLVIGAYRDNEVDANHPLMRKMDVTR